MPRDKPDLLDAAAGRGAAPLNPGELSEADRTILESATGEAQPEHDDQDPEMTAAEDAAYLDAASLPVREGGANQNEAGYDETVDGLSDTEETIRQQAEDHATGDDEDFRP